MQEKDTQGVKGSDPDRALLVCLWYIDKEQDSWSVSSNYRLKRAVIANYTLYIEI